MSDVFGAQSQDSITAQHRSTFFRYFQRNDPRVQVIIGVAGAGKTSWAMSLIEQLLKDGLKWHQIGFLSFSRAACAEAAERAAKITGEAKERLQNDGWFRTVHSAAVRALGIDTKVILDADSAKGREWFTECLGAPRGGDTGTLAGRIGDALDLWDLARSHVWPVIDRQFVIDALDEKSRPATRANRVAEENPVNSAVGATRTTLGPPMVAHVSLVKMLGFCAENDPIGLYRSFQLEHKNVTSREKGGEGGPFCCKSYIGIGLTGAMRENPHGPEEIDGFCKFLAGKMLGKGHPGHQRGGGGGPGGPVSGILERIGKEEILIPLIDKYEESKRLYGRMDFQDVLLRLAGLELQNGAYVQRYQGGSPIDEVQVWICDEWQDSSQLLDCAAQRLWQGSGDVYLLGDRYQAVYGFSGACSDVLKAWEVSAAAAGQRLILNRTWRNPDSVVEWGEEVLREDEEYEERKPISEGSDGSVGLIDWYDFTKNLDRMFRFDTMIVARTWFNLQSVQRALDERGIPWSSLSDKCHSRWDSPAKLAFVLTMRDLIEGKRISEQDWRRVTETLPQKHEGQELFKRGEKAKWKKAVCSIEPQKTLEELEGWGAAAFFRKFVTDGLWRSDMLLLLDSAIERFGLQHVRRPMIRLGTCHSVKGMEAENVFCLATSTEKASEAELMEDLSLRYVVITRASRHYRLVVNQLDMSRGKPMFWAAPRGVVGFDREMEFLNGSGSEDPGEDFGLAQETGTLGSQVSGGNSRDHRDAGHTGVRERDVRGTGSEDAGRTADENAGAPAGGDLEEWWNL